MKVLLTFFIWFSISTTTEVHEFYLSVTDINYVAEKQNLQIISRVFTDDFEDVLNKRYQKDFKLIPSLEVKETEVYIERYINDKLFIESKGDILTLKYLGKKYEDDMVYLYIEIENIDKLNSITIENLILTDLFEEQKNMIHFKSGEFKKSFILEKKLSKRTITF
ncbi:hypothetical protein ES731_07165 [Psychroflexus gondwanensis]|jgi:hypothetical protein|uniref:Peptidase E n=1 Tax=Psychroflexus gondwanensis ACAM 44 TaxID=1189619 RepID=N1WXM6_9FLAO|nr:DUF6702 family protein [Psychroflexus gondwanensis]EMY81874.1 hypothetical protein pgond44_05005 [Psychroflexus gondwanensis ACAM 44]TXE19813.1 hypothetical protein ES731_07165 [Psychroflexus gondwanensis]